MPVLAVNHLWWYTARSSGIVAWAMLTASVLVGLALSTRAFGRRPRANWLLDLHRYMGGAAVVFTAIHMATLVADNYVHFGVTELLVPFTSSYKPSAVAWGVVAFYLLLAVEITSLLRRQLPNRAWRRVHYLSFPLYVMATIHTVTAGTDRGTSLLRAALIAATLVIAGLTALRTYQADQHDLLSRPSAA